MILIPLWCRPMQQYKYDLTLADHPLLSIPEEISKIIMDVQMNFQQLGPILQVMGLNDRVQCLTFLLYRI